MDTFLEKVKNDIARAAEYLKSNFSKRSDGYRVQIESIQDSVHLIRVTSTTNEYRDDFKNVLGDAESILLQLESGLARVESEDKAASSSNSGMKSTRRNLLNIPEFCSNRPSNYRSFINLFMDSVNCNSSLTEIEKLKLLKNHLKGEAYDVINEMPITENNFSRSLSILEEMYGGADEHCNELFDRLKNLQAATDEIADIRRTYWKLEAILRSFEEYGKVANENKLLESYYLEKFVNASSLGIEELRGCKLDVIRERLGREIRAREAKESPPNVAGSILYKNLSSSNNDSSFVTNEREQSKSESVLTKENVESAPSNQSLECIFCGEIHRSEDCTIYPTVTLRKWRIINDLCWKCLEPRDGRKCCLKPMNCDYCSQSHPRVLCPRKCRSLKQNTMLPSFSKEPTSNKPLTECFNFCRRTALTTRTFVQLCDSDRKTSVRLIIDTSSPSMISESVIDRLGVRGEYERKLARDAAGKMTETRMQVLIHVQKDPPIPLNLRIVKEVCEVASATPTVAEFKNHHPHLADWHFPDTGSGLPIELLIGGDTQLSSTQFHNGISLRVNRSRGWSLVSSVFGLIIVHSPRK